MNKEEWDRKERILSQFSNLSTDEKIKVIDGVIEWIEKIKPEISKDDMN